MLLLVRTIVEAPDAGWASAETIAAFAARRRRCWRAFVAIERRVAQPARAARDPALGAAACGRTSAAMALFGAYVGFQFVGTLYLQTLLGWSRARDRAGVPARPALLVAFGVAAHRRRWSTASAPRG